MPSRSDMTEAVYTVTWREHGKPQSDGPHSDYLQAEGRAKAVSMRIHGPVQIEERARVVHARWEAGKQTLSHTMTLTRGMEL